MSSKFDTSQVDTGRKLNVLCTFNVRSVSTGKSVTQMLRLGFVWWVQCYILW